MSLFIFLLVPSLADGASIEKQYDRLHDKATESFGYEVVGRDIVEHGQPVKRRWILGTFDTRRSATKKEITTSMARMRSWLAPPPVVQQTPVATTSTTGGGAGGAAQFSDCESGGDYNAVNPSSGAYGRYQVIPSTWAAHCSDLGRDPGGQDACAGRVYEAQGSGAWAACGG